MQRHLEKHVSCSLHTKELSSNENQVLLGQQDRISGLDDTGKRCWKVDICCCLLLYRLDDLSLATCDDVVELVVDLAYVRVKSALPVACL